MAVDIRGRRLSRHAANEPLRLLAGWIDGSAGCEAHPIRHCRGAHGLAMVACVGAAPAANAGLQNKLDGTLAALWTSVLETPSAQNSFGTGGAEFNCWDLGRTSRRLIPRQWIHAPSGPAPEFSLSATLPSAARSKAMAIRTPSCGPRPRPAKPEQIPGPIAATAVHHPCHRR